MPKYLKKESFKCERCGECCKPITKLTNEDIERIKKIGYKEDHFLAVDPINKKTRNTLKLINGKCVFLTEGDGITYCDIYEHRPENCKNYPFFYDKIKSCKPVKILYYYKEELI
jgi:Fe-S-cluster containining protein